MLYRRLSFDRATTKRPHTGTTLTRSQSTLMKEPLPVVTGIAVSEAYSTVATNTHTALMNFPRFLHSRALKSRANKRQQDSSLHHVSFIFRPSSQGLSQSISDTDLTFTIDTEQSSTKPTTTSPLTRVSRPSDVPISKWLSSKDSHHILSLNKKLRRVKIVVSLPKPGGKAFSRYISNVNFSESDIKSLKRPTKIASNAISKLTRSQTMKAKSGFLKISLK